MFIKDFFNINLNAKIVYLTLFFVFAGLYFINPLINDSITTWDRTFCDALMSGHSIKARINHFYFLFLFVLPIFSVFQNLVISFLFKNKEKFLDSVYNVTLVLSVPLLISYILRYPVGSLEIRNNFFVISLIISQVLLIPLIVIGKKFNFSEHFISFIFLLFIVLSTILGVVFNGEIGFFISCLISACFIYLHKNDVYKNILYTNFVIKTENAVKRVINKIQTIGNLLYKNVLKFLTKNKLSYNTIYFLIAFISVTCTFMIFSGIPIVPSFIIVFFIFKIFGFINCKYNIDKDLVITKNALAFIMCIPVAASILIEVFYSVNQKGVYIESFQYILQVYIIIGVVLSILLAVYFKNKNFEKFGYIAGVIGVLFINTFIAPYQEVIEYISYANIYELANESISIKSLQNGSIPIIDYFSAHALSDVWTKLIYGFTHPNTAYSYITKIYYNLNWLITALALFVILVKLFNIEFASLFVIFCPSTITGHIFACINFINILALLYVLKRPNLKSYFLFWLIILLGGVFKYDNGILLGLACIFTFILLKLSDKRFSDIGKFILSGFVTSICALVLYLIYCNTHEINAVSRLSEWISLSINSTPTWAMETMGKPYSLAFLFCYFIVPSCAIFALMYVYYLYYKTKEHKLLTTLIITFSIGQLLFIPRGIIYHNLFICGGRSGVLLNFWIWTTSLCILLFLENKYKIKNIAQKYFIWLFTLCTAIAISSIILLKSPVHLRHIVLKNVLKSCQNVHRYIQKEKINNQPRIILSEDTRLFVQDFIDIFDILLKKDETFIDFANVTSLYEFTGRKKLFYAAQTPSLLTDLHSQNLYLQEISEYKHPLVIIGIKNDLFIRTMAKVEHTIRYYTIAEYIYRKYRPLITISDFAIWADKNTYEKYYNLLKEQPKYKNKLIDYGYDFGAGEEGEDNHNFNIKLLPFIWANYDKYNAKNNSVLQEAQHDGSNVYKFSGSKNVDKTDGNYILIEGTNNSKIKTSVFVKLYDSLKKDICYQYQFEVPTGSNKFLIRVSTDYFWYAYNINTIEFESQNRFVIKSVKILKGDNIQK